MSNKVLAFTSSGGNGHKIVCSYLRTIEEKKGSQFVEKDLIMVMGKYIGNKAVGSWHDAQKSGDLQLQQRLVKKQPYADIGFYIPVFFKTLYLLFTYKPNKILNTQVLGLHAMLSALQFYNFIRRLFNSNWQPVKMEMWMTDFVSSEATHFLNPLSKLSASKRRLLLVKIPNNLKYFKEKTHFNDHQVQKLTVDELPVNEEYKSEKMNDKTPQSHQPVTFNIDWGIGAKQYGETQRNLLKNSLPQVIDSENGRGFSADMSQYTVKPGELLYTLMLGSQPTEKVVKHFVTEMINIAKTTHKPIHFIAFCGKDTPETSSSLYRQICNQIRENMPIPKNLNLVPLPFQSTKNIAHVMARSDKKFTRAGGSTGFEHLALNKTLKGTGGKVCILAETFFKDLPVSSQKNLSKAIPVWEGGNAQFLQRKIKATILTLDRVAEELKTGIQESCLRACSIDSMEKPFL